MRGLGVDVQARVPEQRLGSLIRLEIPEGYEYWVGLQNFYTITRYNNSFRYALAVYQLAEEVRAGYDQEVM